MEDNVTGGRGAEAPRHPAGDPMTSFSEKSRLWREDDRGPHEARPCTRKRDNERILIVSSRGQPSDARG